MFELKPEEVAGGFVKPLQDKLQYRIVTLSNQLKAILISDPDTDKAAAALDVHAGSLLDPPSVLGLAHFTEHMLFYSSEKYPIEDEYSKFISEHGGHTNAFTAAEDTNYQFDVNWDALDPALDRFAQFFICPLISADGVDRELNAVDSEHGKNLNTDAWRQHQLNKHTANQGHEWSKFFTGNLETLGTTPRAAGLDVRQQVVDFHARYYSSNLMRLAVYGRQSPDELETMVRSKFEAIPNKQLPQPSFPSDVFLPEHVGTLLKVVPERDGNVLELLWAVPPSRREYRAGALDYLSFLLGHEGTGTACAALKRAGLITSLVAGESGSSMESVSMFYVRMELTNAGHERAHEVAAVIFRYLDLLRLRGGVNETLFKEHQALQRLRFDFADKQPPYAYATNLAMSMQHYNDRDLLLAMFSVPTEYNPDSIHRALDAMTPDTVRVYWASKDFAGDATETEPWYGTRYSLQRVPAEWAAAWAAADEAPGELHLPHPNPFISTDFTLHRDPSAPTVPVAIVDDRQLRLFHKLDHTFDTPKGVVYLDFQAPDAYASPESAVLTRLLVKLLTDHLNEELYPAEIAGLNHSVSNTMSGFQVVALGYSHKLLDLVRTLMDRLVNYQIDPARFAVVREDVHKEYQNVRYQQPYQWAMYRMETALRHKRWSIDEYLAVVGHVGPEDVAGLLNRMLSRCFVEGLVVGNIPRADALALGTLLQQQVLAPSPALPRAAPLFPSQARDMRIVQVPVGITSLLEEPGPNPSNDNSAVAVLFQVGPDDLPRNALSQLLLHVGKREAFYQLRTVEQLGYIVSMAGAFHEAVHGLQFILQSNAFSAEHMGQRVEAFIDKLITHVEGLSESDYAAAVAELSKSKLERPKKLYELAGRYWNEVQYGTHLFDRQEQEVAALKTLAKQDLVAFAREIVADVSSRRKLAVHVCGTAESVASCAPTGVDAEPAANANADSAATQELSANGEVGAVAPVALPRSSRPEVVRRISQPWEFKRGCQLYPVPLSRGYKSDLQPPTAEVPKPSRL